MSTKPGGAGKPDADRPEPEVEGDPEHPHPELDEFGHKITDEWVDDEGRDVVSGDWELEEDQKRAGDIPDDER
ncbi:MAG: hypothetical protein JWL73_2093 [Actinomycetia bacterium]|nr:hypothetical protein [Actinomycetes bacterium]